MKREEAVKRIKMILEECNEDEDAVCYVTSYDADALDMAIKALKQEPCEDCISRQAAIDALYDWSEHSMTDAEAWHIRQVIGDIKSMPSAQPDTRLKKIADLVDGSIDHFDLEDAMDLLYQIKEVLK